MNPEIAREDDVEAILAMDSHITPSVLERKIRDGELVLLRKNETIVAYLRYSLFWDNTPFINRLIVEESSRRKGLGKQLIEHWEEMMKEMGFSKAMTSSQSDEYAQRFWGKIGYREIGSFETPGESRELLFMKEFDGHSPNEASEATAFSRASS